MPQVREGLSALAQLQQWNFQLVLNTTASSELITVTFTDDSAGLNTVRHQDVFLFNTLEEALNLLFLPSSIK